LVEVVSKEWKKGTLILAPSSKLAEQWKSIARFPQDPNERFRVLFRRAFPEDPPELADMLLQAVRKVSEKFRS
jgi:hypothetical protein